MTVTNVNNWTKLQIAPWCCCVTRRIRKSNYSKMTNTPRTQGGMAGNGPELGSGEFQEMQIGSNSEDLESFSMTEVFYYTNWRRYYGEICKWFLWNSFSFNELNIKHIRIQTTEKVSTERKKSKRPFLYRVWKFLQVTATSIKGDSEFNTFLTEKYFSVKICSEPVLLDLELPQRYRPIAIMRLCETTG